MIIYDEDQVAAVLARWAREHTRVDAWTVDSPISVRVTGLVSSAWDGFSFGVLECGAGATFFLAFRGDLIEHARAATAQTCERGTVVVLRYDDMLLRLADYDGFESIA